MLRDNWRVVLAIVAGLAATNFTGDLAKVLPLPDAIGKMPDARSGIAYLIDIAVMVPLLSIVGGVSLARQWETVGLAKPWRPAGLMGLCLFAPIIVAGMIFGSVSHDLTLPSFAFLSVLAPFAEEVIYRGLAAGILLTLAGWRFWPAALLPAAVFGLIHVSQGEGLIEMAGILAITSVGGIFFSWLYFRFDRNLWPAIVMHIGMNGVWNVYELGDNAIGGILGNVLRAVSVLGALAFALWGRDWLERTSGTNRSD